MKEVFLLARIEHYFDRTCDRVGEHDDLPRQLLSALQRHAHGDRDALLSVRWIYAQMLETGAAARAGSSPFAWASAAIAHLASDTICRRGHTSLHTVIATLTKMFVALGEHPSAADTLASGEIARAL